MNKILNNLGRYMLKEIVSNAIHYEMDDIKVKALPKRIRVLIDASKYNAILETEDIKKLNNVLPRFNLEVKEWRIFKEETTINIVIDIGEKKWV